MCIVWYVNDRRLRRWQGWPRRSDTCCSGWRRFCLWSMKCKTRRRRNTLHCALRRKPLANRCGALAKMTTKVCRLFVIIEYLCELCRVVLHRSVIQQWYVGAGVIECGRASLDVARELRQQIHEDVHHHVPIVHRTLGVVGASVVMTFLSPTLIYNASVCV